MGPNTIDFSTVFSTEKFLEAIAVFVTVVTIIIIYIPLAVICRRYDRKDQIKVMFTADVITDKIAVFITVVTIIIIYIPLAVICRRYDRKDQIKVGQSLLMDNLFQGLNFISSDA